MEHGRVAVKDRDLTDLLTFYGITDETVQAKMLSIARQAKTPDWWSTYDDILPDWFEAYLSLEEAASVIRTLEAQFVHGLFQPKATLARYPAMAQDRAARGDRSPGEFATQAPGRAYQSQSASRVVGRG